MWETPLLSSPIQSAFRAAAAKHLQWLLAPRLTKSPLERGRGGDLTRGQPLRPFSSGKPRAGPRQGPPPRRRDAHGRTLQPLSPTRRAPHRPNAPSPRGDLPSAPHRSRAPPPPARPPPGPRRAAPPRNGWCRRLPGPGSQGRGRRRRGGGGSPAAAAAPPAWPRAARPRRQPAALRAGRRVGREAPKSGGGVGRGNIKKESGGGRRGAGRQAPAGLQGAAPGYRCACQSERVWVRAAGAAFPAPPSLQFSGGRRESTSR